MNEQMNSLAYCKQQLYAKRGAYIKEADGKTAFLYTKIPTLSALDDQISSCPLLLLQAAGADNYQELAGKIKEKLDRLHKQRDLLLEENGFPADYDTPKFDCDKCSDRGFVGYDMCSCLKKAIAEENYNRSGIGGELKECTFDNFHTYYYPGDPAGADQSPRDIMESVLAKCKKYAEEFSRDGKSLLFMGGTGLGKTHLSAAIGATVIKKGHTAIYDSARNILNEHRENAFGDGDFDTERFVRCDLLLIDDLGSEPKSEFAAATFTDIIDRRLRAKKSTVISTNLSASDMVKAYSPRFVSRVLSCFGLLTFVGKDIRMIKMAGGQ